MGNQQRVDPEAAFVAALSSCHMLTFLALASNKGLSSTAMKTTQSEKNANGKLAITHVDLHPYIAYGGAKGPLCEFIAYKKTGAVVAEAQ